MAANTDEYYMGLALKEAKKGIGRTSPNPCVGAVIVKENLVIAKGYHKKAGTEHAEIHALRTAGNQANGADMYVTLEPCNHFGRTAPCSHFVAASGIRRVIVGMRDPNPLVNGTGIDYLRSKGVEVRWGILEEECRALNRAFIKYITTSRPLVVMKAGVSLDGRISYHPGTGGAITGERSSRKVHQLRNTHDAILVGIGTVNADNPRLTTRLPKGRGRNPIRMILDTNLSINLNARVLDIDADTQTWIFCSRSVGNKKIDVLTERGIKIFQVEIDKTGRLDLDAVLRAGAAHEITSILVEGGAAIHGAFLQQCKADYIYLFYAPIFAGDRGTPLVTGLSVDGGKESAIKLHSMKTRRYGEDILVAGEICYPS